jgi:hypothetical protein
MAAARNPAPAAGKETDAYCTKCKLVLNHVIIAMNGPRIARVQCLTCEGVHAYRANPPGTRKKASSRRSEPTPAELYERLMEGRDVASAKGYRLEAHFDEGDVLNHKKFGLGLVTRVLADAKIEVIFEDGVKVLVHERTAV